MVERLRCEAEDSGGVRTSFLRSCGCGGGRQGGGQLGRMMGLESPRLNITMSFLDPGGTTSPTASVAGVAGGKIVKGKLDDEMALRTLVEGCDVVTCEIEHIGTEVLEVLEGEGVKVAPSVRVVRIIQDKLVQKVRLLCVCVCLCLCLGMD